MNFILRSVRLSETQINEAYDQSVSKINTKPVLIERKQVDKIIESNIW